MVFPMAFPMASKFELVITGHLAYYVFSITFFKVEQQKAGLENLRIENLNLEREAREAKKEKDRIKLDLEKKLVFATTVLNEVSGMEAIKG
jgi:hypothetical protein